VTVLGTDDARLDSDEIQGLIHAPAVEVGKRSDAVFRVMYACGQAGWVNHDILRLASELFDRWGVHTSANLYDHWSRLLSMLRRVRAQYPSPGREPK